MAYQRFHPQWSEFVLDLHGVRTQDARRAICMRIEECCRYGISVLKVIYGTPDWHPGSIAETLHELVLKHPQVVQELLPSQFVVDGEQFSKRTGWIKLYLRPDPDPLPQDAHMRFSPFAAEREPDRWSRILCEHRYFPLKEWVTLDEAVAYIGEGCTLQDVQQRASRLVADSGQTSGEPQVLSFSSLRSVAESWWASTPAVRKPEMKEAEAAPEPSPAGGEESVFSEAAWWLAIDAGDECLKAGRFAQAEGHLRRALKLVERFPLQPRARVATLSRLSHLCEAQSRYEEAEHYYTALVEALEGDPTTEPWEVHSALCGLASVCAAQQRRAEALKATERLLASIEEVTGAADEQLVGTLEEAALLCEKVERYDLAEMVLKKVLSLEAQTGASSQLRALLLSRHAHLCMEHRRFPEAAASLEEAITACEQALGPADPGLWRLRSLLAQVRLILGQHSAAEQLLQALLIDQESRQEQDSSAIAWTLETLGKLHLNQCRYGEAEQAYRRALDFSRRAGDDPLTIRITGCIGEVLQLTNDSSEAEKVFREALESAERLHGPDHPDVATIARNLATVLLTTERLEEAEPFFERALLIEEVELGAEHPAVAFTLSSFGLLRFRQELYPEAEQMWKRSLAILRKAVGEKHPRCAQVLVSLGLVYTQYADHRSARDVLEAALEIQEQALGHGHPDLLSTLEGLAYVFTMMGQKKAAGRMSRRIRDIEKLHPPKD